MSEAKWKALLDDGPGSLRQAIEKTIAGYHPHDGDDCLTNSQILLQSTGVLLRALAYARMAETVGLVDGGRGINGLAIFTSFTEQDFIQGVLAVACLIEGGGELERMVDVAKDMVDTGTGGRQ